MQPDDAVWGNTVNTIPNDDSGFKDNSLFHWQTMKVAQ